MIDSLLTVNPVEIKIALKNVRSPFLTINSHKSSFYIEVHENTFSIGDPLNLRYILIY